MIAPWRESSTTACKQDTRLREAHEYLATSMFAEPVETRGPALAPWKAWALVGWMVFVTALWAASMLNWW